MGPLRTHCMSDGHVWPSQSSREDGHIPPAVGKKKKVKTQANGNFASQATV